MKDKERYIGFQKNYLVKCIVRKNLLKNHRMLDKLNSTILSPQMTELYFLLQ